MLERLKPLLSGVLDSVRRLIPGTGGQDAAHLRVGRRGERLAARHLRGKGYRILERNFTTTLGEVDLVAFRDGTVAFVEVRTQTHPALIDPEHTITREKQRRVVRASEQYCTVRGLDRPGLALRYDVVTVLLEADGSVRTLRHLENAFQGTPRAFS